MIYKIGMLFYGSAKSVGNVWIVTDDGQSVTFGYGGQMPSIALLFDGRQKLFCNDYKTTKHDYIRAGTLLREADPKDVAFNGGIQLSNFPNWAQTYINQYTYYPLVNGLKPNSVQLPIGTLKKVYKYLGGNDEKDLTGNNLPVKVEIESCAKSSNGEHDFVNYTGFVESYDYCLHCDVKRRSMRSS